MENENNLKTYCDVPGFSHIANEDIEKFQKLAYRIIYDDFPGGELDFDEKESAGMIGVMNGLNSYDPSRGVTLAYWIAWNVKKSIRDETRLYRRQLRYAKEKKYKKALCEAFERRMENVNSDEDLRLIEIDDEKKRALIKDAMFSLNDVERRYVQRLYFDAVSQKELALELNVSQSWVSRVWRRALKKMKKRLEELDVNSIL